MKSAILILNNLENLDLERLKIILRKKYNFNFQTKNSIVYQSPDDEEEFLSFLGGEIENDYEEQQLHYIHQFFVSPNFYYIEFYRFSLFKEIVAFLNDYVKMMIDDDKGHIYDVRSFMKLEEW